MASADSITLSEFKEVLDRYPALIRGLSKPAGAGGKTLEDLDKFRYIDAPSRFSKNTGDTPMVLADIQMLVDWKLRHGTFRPTLPKQVASNSEETVKEAITAAFAHYASNPSDIAKVLELLTKPLKGIGPATGSLILAVHDPDNVTFSDEAYRWLVKGGEKAKILYKSSEFEELFSKAKELQNRLKVSPIDIEKVAYVIIRETEPPKSKPDTPSGRGRGRPRLPESEKKTKKPAIPGRGRGRPKGSTKVPPKTPTSEPRKRGRPAGSAKVKKLEEMAEKAEVIRDVNDPESPSAKRAKI